MRTLLTTLFVGSALLLAGCAGSESTVQEAPPEYAGRQDYIQLSENLTLTQREGHIVLQTEAGQTELSDLDILVLWSALGSTLRQSFIEEPAPMPCDPKSPILVINGYIPCPPPPLEELQLGRLDDIRFLEEMPASEKLIAVPSGYLIKDSRN